MRHDTRRLVGFAVFFLCILLAAVAFGRPVGATMLDPVLSEGSLLRGSSVAFLVDLAAVTLGPLVIALIAAVIGRLYVLLGLKQSAENRATIEQVLDRAIDFARAKYGSAATGHIPDAMRSSALRAAAEYAIERGPKALKAEGITRADSASLERMLTGRFADTMTPFAVASGTLKN